ncbi:hypothetical protein [Pseudobutyrivibrio sp.]|uniref:hypothetical protein n=1 Tax=Pseudobutyrivibrio sp. TaxID=2014367 RepID=UPI001E02D18B|nr:hypothetical protein [Pseudobutyrivibrio sp.]MBE5911510.1 hypothetical protein [Pseudobutyrivibrio sp.]
MKTKWLILVAAALVLVSGTAVKPAIAYFTDTISTEGKIELKLGDSEIPPMEDKVENMIKKISISNTGDYELLVRAKALYPDNCTVTLVDSEGWSDGGDGYYYYSDIVSPGEKTNQLLLQINSEAEESFNVIIVQEGAKVIYDEDGSYTGDWDAKISSQIDEKVDRR